MEEKERYIIGKGEDIFIADNDRKAMFTITTKKLQDLLNQQTKRIKELEEELEEINLGSDFIYEQSGATIKDLIKENQQLKKQVEELKGKRLEFYNDDVRRTQVINGVHFDIEQLLVFSEYVEHERNIMADKDKKINQLNQQLHDLLKKIVGEIVTKINEDMTIAEDYWKIRNILDTILKKFGGENESNNDKH